MDPGQSLQPPGQCGGTKVQGRPLRQRQGGEVFVGTLVVLGVSVLWDGSKMGRGNAGGSLVSRGYYLLWLSQSSPSTLVALNVVIRRTMFYHGSIWILRECREANGRYSMSYTPRSNPSCQVPSQSTLRPRHSVSSSTSLPPLTSLASCIILYRPYSQNQALGQGKLVKNRTNYRVSPEHARALSLLKGGTAQEGGGDGKDKDVRRQGGVAGCSSSEQALGLFRTAKPATAGTEATATSRTLPDSDNCHETGVPRSKIRRLELRTEVGGGQNAESSACTAKDLEQGGGNGCGSGDGGGGGVRGKTIGSGCSDSAEAKPIPGNPSSAPATKARTAVGWQGLQSRFGRPGAGGGGVAGGAESTAMIARAGARIGAVATGAAVAAAMVPAAGAAQGETQTTPKLKSRTKQSSSSESTGGVAASVRKEETELGAEFICCLGVRACSRNLCG